MAQNLSLHNQWETLCSRAKLQSAKLSQDATQWQLYQQQVEQLKPWLKQTEERLEGKTSHMECSSMEDVEELLEELQVITTK